MKKSQTHSKGGRPSKYKSEYADKLITYFEDYLREPFTKEVIKTTTISRKGSEIVTVEYKLISKPLPSLFSFSREINISYWTLNHWATEKVGEPPGLGEDDKRDFLHPEFSQAYKTRIYYQEQFLSHVGLGNIANPAYAIFTAKNILGWRDTTDQRFLDKDGNAMTPSYIVLPKRMDATEVAKELSNKN